MEQTIERTADNKLIMTEKDFFAAVSNGVEQLVEKIGLKNAVVPGAVAGTRGAQDDYRPLPNESLGEKRIRLRKASFAVSGGGLAVEKAPKEIKLLRFYKAMMERDDTVVKALSEGTAVDGGNLVPVEFGTDLLVAIEQYSLSRLCDPQDMTTNEKDLRSVTTKPLIYQVAEGVAPAGAAPKFGKPILTAKAFAGLQVMSREVFDDNNVGLYDKLIALFAEQFAAKESSEIITGTAFTGIISSVTPTLTRMAGAAFTDLKYKEVVDCSNSLSPGQLMNGAVWIMHRTVWSIVQNMTDSNNRPIATNPWDAKSRTLLGYPVILDEQAPAASTTAADTAFIIFGNPRWVSFGRRQGFRTQLMIEGTAAGVNLGETRQLGLIIDTRWGLVVTIPANLAYIKTAV